MRDYFEVEVTFKDGTYKYFKTCDDIEYDKKGLSFRCCMKLNSEEGSRHKWVAVTVPMNNILYWTTDNEE